MPEPVPEAMPEPPAWPMPDPVVSDVVASDVLASDVSASGVSAPDAWAPDAWAPDISAAGAPAADSEPATVWSIPDVVPQSGSGEADFSATAAHDAAAALIAEALRQAEAEAAAAATQSEGGWAHTDITEDGVDDGSWNLGSVPETPAWHFILADGSSVGFGPWALVGREATVDDRWPDAELVTIEDTTASMSKTHVRLETDERGLVVVDLFSLNGTVITTDDGRTIDLRDGNRTRLTSGARIALGDFVARLERV